jgi:hypothetical protein
MRRILLTTVAAMAITSPALAADISAGYAPPSGDPIYNPAPMVVGDLEMALGWSSIDLEGDEDWNTFSGWGRANIPVGDTWNVLLEAGGGALFGGDFGDGLSIANAGANAHLWANRDALRYGVFGGASFGTAGIVTFGTVGIEMEVDMDNAVLGAGGFYSSTNACGGCDSYGVSGWVDYYLTPNTKATGTLSWSKTDLDLGGDLDVFGGSGRLTHRVTGTPINIFGEASFYNADLGSDDGNITNVSGGFTVMLDGPGYTQQEFDRNVPFTFRHPLNADLGD